MTTQGIGRTAGPTLRLPEAPAELRRRRVTVATFFKFFGPGAIIASLTIGSGESILASREGAVFGYAVLWAVVVGSIAKGALVYASNRHVTLTGEHPMMRFARVLPGPRGWFPLLLVLIYGAGLLYVDKVNLPAPYRMSTLLRTLVALSSVFLTVSGVIAMLAYVGVIA